MVLSSTLPLLSVTHPGCSFQYQMLNFCKTETQCQDINLNKDAVLYFSDTVLVIYMHCKVFAERIS